MAVLAMILGSSGDGKTSSLVVNPDGGIHIGSEDYEGFTPEGTMIFNLDGGPMPFSPVIGFKEGESLFTSTYDKPITADTLTNDKDGWLKRINKRTDIKRVVIDTINGGMNDKELLETRKMTYDKWYDLAKDWYKLCVLCNSLRDDLIVYLFGHTVLVTNQRGEEERQLLTNGKKLEKIKLESKVSIVLNTHVDSGADGDNKYWFETQKNKSTGKSPLGMFDEFLIPNSLKLVDDKIRQYYNIK